MLREPRVALLIVWATFEVAITFSKVNVLRMIHVFSLRLDSHRVSILTIWTFFLIGGILEWLA